MAGRAGPGCFLERARLRWTTHHPGPPSRASSDRRGGAGAGPVFIQRFDDDVGPYTYRGYQDGRFIAATTSTSTLLGVSETEHELVLRARRHPVGHLGRPLTVRFRVGLSVVDGRRKARPRHDSPGPQSGASRFAGRQERGVALLGCRERSQQPKRLQGEGSERGR